jgi:CHASE3 domain sensor protein
MPISALITLLFHVMLTSIEIYLLISYIQCYLSSANLQNLNDNQTKNSTEKQLFCKFTKPIDLESI